MLPISILIGLLFAVPESTPAAISEHALVPASSVLVTVPAPDTAAKMTAPDVPFYSQFEDIHDPRWQKIGCGIASLAMIINYYDPGAVSVDALLRQGINAGAYAANAGWKHRDLALLGERYGLEGKSYDLAQLDTKSAFAQFKETLEEGPAIASVHYQFDPKSTIPHLVVITGTVGDRVYYNDPSGHAPGQYLSTSEFLAAWKKRYIAFNGDVLSASHRNI